LSGISEVRRGNERHLMSFNVKYHKNTMFMTLLPKTIVLVVSATASFLT
jgi:hypothetical protein